MAELVVRAHYESTPRKTMLGVLRVSFPLWGIACPIGYVSCLCTVIVTMSSAHLGELPAQVLWLMMTFLAFPLIGLLLTRALAKDSIVVDRDGVQLAFTPINLLGLKSYAAWQSISKIMVFDDKEAGESWKKKKIVLFRKSGAKMLLQLNKMKPEEIEQLILAMEMWGGSCEIDPSVQLLRDSLKSETSAVQGLSYTDMWEDELRRRFCATAFMPLAPGRTLKDGRLSVVRQLALGGLSAVYLAQLDGKQLVVLKEAVIPEDVTEHMKQKALEMFEREADILVKLSHANIVRVLEHFTDGGRNYLMLEYINGQDIRQLVKQNGPQKEATVIDWAIQISMILKYLHEQDPAIIHRDLTPDNLVLREDGSIMLIDFGAANEFLSNATGTFVGKQSFIAPEQFRGKAVVQSDIYAFGGTLFYMITGQEPEALSTSDPREVNSAISEDLSEVIISCTQMEARDRYQSAAQMLPVLRKIAASLLSV